LLYNHQSTPLSEPVGYQILGLALSVCHSGRFIAAAKTREAGLAMADLAVTVTISAVKWACPRLAQDWPGAHAVIQMEWFCQSLRRAILFGNGTPAAA